MALILTIVLVVRYNLNIFLKIKPNCDPITNSLKNMYSGCHSSFCHFHTHDLRKYSSLNEFGPSVRASQDFVI